MFIHRVSHWTEEDKRRESILSSLNMDSLSYQDLIFLRHKLKKEMRKRRWELRIIDLFSIFRNKQRR